MLQETFHARYDTVEEYQEARQEAIEGLSQIYLDPQKAEHYALKFNNQAFDDIRPELLSKAQLTHLLTMAGSELAARHDLQIED